MGDKTASQATSQEQAQQQVSATPADLFTGFPNAPTAVTIPAGMPGQLPSIAQQLSRGFDGSPAEFLAYLNNIHKPTTYMAYGRDGASAADGGNQQSAAGSPGIPDLFKLMNVPNPNSMPYEQWNTFINSASRLPSGSYAGMNYDDPQWS